MLLLYFPNICIELKKGELAVSSYMVPKQF